VLARPCIHDGQIAQEFTITLWRVSRLRKFDLHQLKPGLRRKARMRGAHECQFDAASAKVAGSEPEL